MIKRYIKQTWQLLRQDRLFGTLYIIGTAIPVALTMIVITFQYIRVGSIYPEYDRDELWVSERAEFVNTANGSYMSSAGAISLRTVKEWFYPLRKYGHVTALQCFNDVFVQLPDGKNMRVVKVMATDTDFFRVFNFEFLAGKPFTEADFHSGRYCTVIAASLAGQLFGSAEEAVGKTIWMNLTDYVVTGVVRDASSLTPRAYAQVYTPYTCLKETEIPDPFNVCGRYKVCIRASEDNGRQIQAEIEERMRQVNVNDEEQHVFVETPYKSWRANIAGNSGGEDEKLAKSLRIFGGLLIVFLLVPALNLSGMIAGRMEKRLSEMGVCKAFGATRRHLLGQVMGENLVLTLIGGCFGLLISWCLLVWGRHWVFDFFSPGFYIFTENTDDVLLRGEMLFSPWIFLSAFLVCAVLNVVSALIPAWNALKAEIVYSLNQKK